MADISVDFYEGRALEVGVNRNLKPVVLMHHRRHQLSHQKPAYPCTFEDCERAFHRPDLLARHLHRQ